MSTDSSALVSSTLAIEPDNTLVVPEWSNFVPTTSQISSELNDADGGDYYGGDPS